MACGLTQEQLLALFDYRDGELFYKKSPLPKIKVGSKAGSIGKLGYVKVSIDSKKYSAHRLIFLMMHGYVPDFLDHINGNRADNRIENLRGCSKQENSQNVSFRKSSKSGIKNVSWHKPTSKYQVDIMVDSKKKYIGVFDDIELAELVAMEARNKYHGAFANHGIGA
jgi:hypothetical protein